ncbi:hypothetical protein [Flaviflexus massiliensis]|uniref:hypothetical protein n=1 Tax=Flaviflexus massiliensis TaxID=1522309 RepID=UPI0006D564BD|nr:hypothetical protein [Flaviflexus massiliensis]
MTDLDPLEHVARKLCIADGNDPDRHVWEHDEYGRRTVSEPAWTHYVPVFEKLLSAPVETEGDDDD